MDRCKDLPTAPAGVQLVQLDGLQVEIPAKALAALAEILDQIARDYSDVCEKQSVEALLKDILGTFSMGNQTSSLMSSSAFNCPPFISAK